MKKELSSEKVRISNKKFNFFSILCGCLAGLVNGLFGGGGGMIIVPMLTNLLNKQENRAHATAILIILPLCIVSGLFYAAFGNLDWTVGLPVTIGVVFGGVIGALLLSKLTSKWVGIIFSIVMAGAGIKLLLF